MLLEHYGGALAINDDSDVVHHYNGIVWEPVSDKELQRFMAKIFIDAEISYSQNAIKFAVETMKLSLPVMGERTEILLGSVTVFLISGQEIFGNTTKMTGC